MKTYSFLFNLCLANLISIGWITERAAAMRGVVHSVFDMDFDWPRPFFFLSCSFPTGHRPLCLCDGRLTSPQRLGQLLYGFPPRPADSASSSSIFRLPPLPDELCTQRSYTLPLLPYTIWKMFISWWLPPAFWIVATVTVWSGIRRHQGSLLVSMATFTRYPEQLIPILTFD